MTHVTSAWPLFPLLLAAACGAPDSGAASPGSSAGNGTWTEITTPHFTLKTDLDRDVARKVSADLETMFSALSDLGFASSLEVKSRMDVVHFRHRSDYEQVAPKGSAAIFKFDVHDFERTPLAIVSGDFTQRTREVIQHELGHLFVHAYYPQAPIWLDEGLAQYFQTLDLDGDTAVLGRMPRGQRFVKGPWGQTLEDGEYRLAIPMSEAPSVSALTSMDVTEFEGAAQHDPQSSEAQNAIKKMSANYAGAWSLVHLLMVSPNYKATFEDYQRRLLKGQDSGAAWGETLGKVPLEKLERDYTDSLVRFETMIYRTKYTAPTTRAAEPRALGRADVRVLWARLRDWKSPAGRAAAQRDMQEARTLEPRNPELAALTSYWEEDAGNIAAAKEALKGALAERPNDARLLNAAGWVEFSAIVKKTSTPDALEPVATQLAPIAKTAAELDLLARYHYLRDDLDTALTYEKRAVLADPSCSECFSGAAIMLGEKGRFREALQAATLALALLPDGASSPSLVTQIQTYRRKLRDGGR